jgi:lipid-binding SYLF domain-containing protein
MLKAVVTLLVIGWASSVLALDKAQLERRIESLTAKLKALQAKPDKAIPAAMMQAARGIILLERTKAGFVFGYEGGDGIAMVRDTNTGEWSPPAFLRAREASLGIQAGRQQMFVVILLMNDGVTRALSDPTYKLSDGVPQNPDSDERNTISPASSKAESTVKVFGDRHGIFGGLATKSGAIVPDQEANRICYGRSVSMEEILVDRKVAPSDAATALVQKLTGTPITASQ